jgi:hypothetical protein
MIWSECSAVSEVAAAASHIETVERGYEYLLAYAAQGRQDDAGTELRDTLARMHAALAGLDGAMVQGLPNSSVDGTADFAAAVTRDIRVARGALGLVLSRPKISSLLVDNLNASVHLRALLTDLFLIDQVGRS